MTDPAITLSIVSHRQNALVNQFLGDVQRHCRTPLKLILTQNAADAVPLAAAGEIIVNGSPKGFGANHNSAFAGCGTPFYCVANPDVRLSTDPFPALLQALQAPNSGVVGPRVCDPEGRIEDSVRRFPTVGGLVRKLLVGAKGPDYPVGQGPREVDWVAGMFMLFRSDAFRAVGGFDERFFLYYEDVDVCRRLLARGYRCLFQPEALVTHDARRASRRDLRLMGIHAASAARYLTRRYR